MEIFERALALPLVDVLVAAGYLAGSIPFGFILAKLVSGKDVRTEGSGNIGATNVARVVGKKLGVVVLLLDAGKGFVPVLVTAQLTHDTAAEGLVCLAALLGHCFPIWLWFRGGKGVATGLGVLLAHRPDVAAVGLVAFALAFAAVRKVSVGSLVAAVASHRGARRARPSRRHACADQSLRRPHRRETPRQHP